jgi:hypothetical protein
MKTRLDKMAQHDAERWAAAEMAYGDGAGTRRKLMSAELQTKMIDIPGYWDAFDRAYNGLNMNKFAKAAVKERKALDRAAKAGKNLRALRTGNFQNLSTGVFIAAGTAYVLHATGYDKVLYQEGQKAYKKARVEVKYRWAKWQGRNVERIG